jgi:hypothetical protein
MSQHFCGLVSGDRLEQSWLVIRGLFRSQATNSETSRNRAADRAIEPGTRLGLMVDWSRSGGGSPTDHRLCRITVAFSTDYLCDLGLNSGFEAN